MSTITDKASETMVVTLTQLADNMVIVVHEATVISEFFVDQYFKNSYTIPYAYTTLSTSIITALNQDVQIASTSSTVYTFSSATSSQGISLETISSSLSMYQESVAMKSSSNPTPSIPTSTQPMSTVSSTTLSTASNSTVVSLNNLTEQSTQTESNKTVLGLAIGLPLGIFVLGLLVILGLVVYRRRYRHSFERDTVEWGNKENFELSHEDDHSSNINRKVKNPYISHPTLIHTPQKLAFASNPYRSKEKTDENMCNYTSPFADPKAPISSPFRSRRWNYESPLSRWFLTKSTLIQDRIQTAKTPTMNLKQLNILSRASKSKVDVGGEVPETESSLILPSAPRTPYDSVPSSIIHAYQSNDVTTAPNQTSEHKIQPQILTPLKDDPFQPVVKLEKLDGTKPLPNLPANPLTKNMLSPTKNSTNEDERQVYEVIRDYQAVLMDEINIKKGELVCVLAKHTDGWCLVERHNIWLENNVDGPNYINKDRGIVPGICLEARNTQKRPT